VVAPGNPLGLRDIATVAQAGACMAQRPAGAGAQLLLVALMTRAGIGAGGLALVKPVCPTGPDLGQAVRAGPRRLWHRQPLGGACGGTRLRAAHLGAVRSGFAPARLFSARAAGAVRPHPRAWLPRQAAAMQGYDVVEAGRCGWSIDWKASASARLDLKMRAPSRRSAGEVAEWLKALKRAPRAS